MWAVSQKCVMIRQCLLCTPAIIIHVYCHLQILPDIIQGCKMSSTGGKKKKKVIKANSLGKVGELEKLLIGVLTVSTEFVYFPY